MANNNSIFVPQTFNGARMVNVTKRTHAPSTETSTALSHSMVDTTTATTPSNTNAPSEHKKESKPADIHASPKAKVIAIKPYASSQSVIDTRAKSCSHHTSRTVTSCSPSSSSAKPPIVPSPLQHLEQQQQHAPIPVQPRVSPPQPHLHPQVMLQPSVVPGPYDVVGYERVWSEANVAVLIQLHRKHYNGVTSLDTDQQKAAWAALTSEYNAITADNRSTPALIKKWDKLMAKYNAERAFLIMPRPQGLQQPVPIVSYWNHFQYMDSYLSHVPIPENCIHKRKRRVVEEEEEEKVEQKSGEKDNLSAAASHAKRPRTTTDLSMALLETQRVFMEKTLDKQNTQIEMMKANADAMHRMNMKFVNICEKACTKSQANEERYLKLLEKCLVLNNNNNNSTRDVAAAILTDVAAEQPQTREASSLTRPASPSPSIYSSATD